MEKLIEMSLLALLVIALSAPSIINLLAPEQKPDEQEEDATAS